MLETGEIWDDLNWEEKQEWEERDDMEDYWVEEDFYTFDNKNHVRRSIEMPAFFFTPIYDEYHEYGERTIAAFLNIRNPKLNPTIKDAGVTNTAGEDAMNALIANTEVSAHFATPPYLQEELNNGMHIIADGEDIAGAQFTFISGVAMEQFYEDYPELYTAFIETLNEAIDYINENPDEAIRILAPLYGLSEEELKELMSYGGTIYSSDLCGVEPIKQAMYEMGFLKENYDYKDLCFDNVVWKEEYKAEEKQEK